MLAALLAAGACTATGPAEGKQDCFALGGGFEGEDTAAIQAECEADERGEYCDAAAFIESDAAKCIALGEWSDDVDRDHEAGLFYSYGYRTVLWRVQVPGSDSAMYVHATTGERYGLITMD